jgi:hypothetical protein
MIKGIFIFFFATLLFVGNIGIPVFTHACEEDGVFQSFFINTTNHCEEEVSNLPPCCTDEQSEKDDCCHDETSVIQLKIDYSLSWNSFSLACFYAPLEAIIPVYTSDELLFQEPLNTNKGNDPPPKLWGKSLLIQHQTFQL